jgi:hypothetical protein
MSSHHSQDLAGIQYMGEPGISADCKNAVIRLIQFGDRLQHARVLTSNAQHAFMLTTSIGDPIAIKSGFASGYGGEGPHAFSFVLSLLESHGVEVDEVNVSQELLLRLDGSALTASDLDAINRAKRVRPRRLDGYVTERDWERARSGAAWDEFPRVVPFALIDQRIADLVRGFWKDADGHLLTAWRRLEDLVRDRTRSRDHGARLFSTAFQSEKSMLYWPDIDNGEQTGRASMFIGAYAAYRNPRAHRELEHDTLAQLGELLVVNQLYLWEHIAVDRGVAITG